MATNEDWLSQAAEDFVQQQATRARAGAVGQQDIGLDPETAGQVWQQGQAQGIPPEVALRNVDEIRAEAERKRMDALAQHSPGVAGWIAARPERLAVAKDDLDNASALEAAVTGYVDAAYRAPTGGVLQYVGSALRGIGELRDSYDRTSARLSMDAMEAVFGEESTREWFGADRYDALRADPLAPSRERVPFWLDPAELARRGGDQVSAVAQVIGVPDERRNFLTDVTGGVGQLGGMVAQSIFAPQTLLPSLLGSGADVQAQRAEEAGQEGTAAADVATLAGAPVTALLERFALGKLLERVPPKIRNGLARKLTDLGIAFTIEGTQEATEAIAQNAITAVTTDPDQQLTEGVAREATVAGTAATVVRTLLGVRSPLRPVVESQDDQRTLDQLHAIGAQLKVAARAPAEAEALVEEILARSGRGPQHVYVDAQALAAEWRSRGLDPVDQAQAVFGSAEAFTDAATAGHDLPVSMPRYLVHATRTPTADAIRQATRLAPERLTAAEIDALEIDTVLARELPARTSAETRAETEGLLREQLLAARVTPEEATSRAREVAARIIAAEDEVTLAESDFAGLDLGPEPGRLGITDSQWSGYQAHLEAAHEQARSAVMERLMSAEQRKRERWYTEEQARVRAQVEDELELPMAMRAWQILAGRAEVNGEPVPANLAGLKLDRAALVEAFGKDYVQANLKPLGVYRTQGGQNPDAVAVALGYPSGDALVQALAGVKGAQVRAAVEVERRMRGRVPDALFDGSLPDVAAEALHNDARFQALDAELGILAQLANEPRPDASNLRRMAEAKIDQVQIADLRPGVYLAAERKAAREAQQASSRREFAAALQAKRRQAQNAALYAAARRAQARIDTQVRYARSLSKKAARERLGRAGADLLATVDEILSAYSFRPVSDAQRRREGRLRRWFDRMVEAGVQPQVPEHMMAHLESADRVHYRELTPEQLQAVTETLEQLDHQATTLGELRLAGERLQLDETAAELSQAIRANLKDRGPPPASEVLRRTALEKGKRAWRMAGAILTRPRALAAMVDGEGNVEGVFHRRVIRPLDKAQADYLDAMNEYGTKVSALFEAHLKGRDLTRPIWIPSIGQNMTKADLLAVALNLGNAGNLQRLRDGRQWGDVQLMDMTRHLDKADWDFVQGVWDTLETLWPKIAEQQKRLTGIEPGRVQARAINTPFGTYRGGYYPIVYDRESPEWRQFGRDAADSWFDQVAMMALPPNGHTEARVRKARIPIKLDLGVVPQHLSSILKDLTHRETVISLRKLVQHHDVIGALGETVGVEFQSMLEDKLKQVATDQVIEAARSMDGLRKVSRAIRRHVGVMAMGLNVVTGLKQIIGLTNSMEVLMARHGAKAPRLLLRGYHQLLQGWGGTVDAVTALSGEMRHRMNNADADIRLAMDRYLSGKMRPGVRGTAARTIDGARVHAHVLIRYAQFYLVDLPLWLGAHSGALQRGKSAADAIAAADDAVIVSQGAGGAKDTALIEGNVPGVELFTMFYSYASAFLQRQVSMGRQLGKALEGGPRQLASELPLLSARMTMLLVLPVILDDLISRAAGSAEEPDEPEGWASYYFMRVLAYQFYGLPGFRDIVGAKFGYRATPADAIGNAYLRLAGDMEDALAGEDVEARKVARNTVTAIGYTTGLPLAGPWRHVDYLWRVLAGDEEPETVPEFAAAALIGKREEK